MIKIIYFSNVTDTIGCATDLNSQGFVCFMDQPPNSDFLGIAPLDSAVTEQAIDFLFHRLDTCGEFEAAIIHAQLFTHYPRLFRCVSAFSHSRKENIVYFIPREQVSVYDLAFAFNGDCDFEYLEESTLEKANLHQLVEFYYPDTSVLQFKELITDIVASATELFLKLLHRQRRKRHTPKVLFIAHDNEVNLYLRPLISVFEELGNRGVPYVVISCDMRAKRFLTDEGVPYMELEELLKSDEAADHNAPADAGDMERWFRRMVNGTMPATSDRLYGALFQCSLNSAVRRDIWQNRKSALRLINFIDNNQISDVFFVPDGTPIAASLYRPLVRQGVRLHTLVAAGISKLKRTVGTYFSGNIYCAGSLAESALKFHFPTRHIIPCGSPGLHRYKVSPTFTPGDQRVVILIATSGYDDSEVDWMEALAHGIDDHRYILVLKPHPSYAKRYCSLASSFSKHLIVEPGNAIEPYVNGAAIVVTDHSQVGVDAHLLGKPVISMYMGEGAVEHIPQVSSILFVKTIPALLDAINKCQIEPMPVSTEFIQQYNYGGDTFYYRRIVEHVIQDE